MLDLSIYVLNNWRLFQILLEISFLLFMKILRVKKFNSKFSGTAIERWRSVERKAGEWNTKVVFISNVRSPLP
jgi:hypothetical protein